MPPASRVEIAQLVIEPLKATYSPLHNPDREPIQFGTMSNMLIDDIFDNNFTVGVLRDGMTAFRQEWTYRRWPVFGELKPFLSAAELKTRPMVAKTDDRPEPNYRWAAHLMHSQNGQTAIRGGLALSLWEWGLENDGKVPQSADMAELVNVTKRQNANMELLRGSADKIDQGLLKIGEGMEARRVKLEKQFERAPA